MTNVTNTPIALLSPATERLINLLRSAEEGDLLVYSQLDAAAGFSVRERRGILHTAIKRVLIDDSMHFGVVRGEGYKRLTQAEAAESLSSQLQRVRCAAKRGSKTAQRVDLLQVPDDKRSEFVARATLCELIAESTTARKQKKLASAASKTDRPNLMLRDALDALKNGD